MATLRETFTYNIIGKDSGKTYATLNFQDLKGDIQSRISKLSSDELTNLVLFNTTFDNEEELIIYLLDLLAQKGNYISTDNEDIKLEFDEVTYKKDDLVGTYPLQITYKNDIETLFFTESELRISNNDFKNSLFGLLKLAYYVNSITESQGMLSEEEAASKGLWRLYNLYNDFISLANAKGYNEAKGYIEALYRGLTYDNSLNINLTEIRKLYFGLDDKVNRNYQSKPTQGQIDVVSSIRKYLVKFFKSNTIDFKKLTKAYYSEYGSISDELFNEVDLIVKSGPYYNDGFDKDMYNSLSKKDKIKYVYNFLQGLSRRGELNLSSTNHRYIIKMLSSINYIKEIKSKEESESFERDR